MAKPDIEMIYIQYNLGKYFGLTRSVSENSKKSFAYWYVPVLMIIFVLFEMYQIWKIIVSYSTFSLNVPLMKHIINTSYWMACVIYIGLSLIRSQFSKKKWTRLFKNIDSLEQLPLGHFIGNKTPNCFKLCTAIYHIIFLMYHLSMCSGFILENRLSDIHLSVTIIVTIYYQTFDVILICLFNRMVARRYGYLTEMIQSVSNDRNVNVTITEEERERRCFELKKVFPAYQILHECVEHLNDIFGWKIFVFLQLTVLTFLRAFNSVILNIQGREEYNLQRKIVYISLPTFFLIIASTLIMSCNGVEESGRKVTTTCYMRLGNLEKSALRDELLILAKCTEQLQPKVSAAGFFTLNQATLTSMFSFVTTYLIIVIQFNLL